MDLKDGPQMIEHLSYSLDDIIYDVKWVDRKSQVICVGESLDRKGFVNIYDLNKGDFKPITENRTVSGIKTTTSFFSHTGAYTIACGCFDGSILVYDISNMSHPVYKIKRHKQLVNKLDNKSIYNNNVLVSASRDGSVRVFDIRAKQEVVTLVAPKEARYIPDCWCVATGNNYVEKISSTLPPREHFNICAGYDNGDVKFFDLKTMAIEHEVNLDNGVCSLSYDRKDSRQDKLVCSTLEGNIYVFNLAIYDENQGYSFAKDKIISGTCWGTPFLPQNRDIFACLGGDGNLIIFQYQYPEKVFVYHESEASKVGVVGSIKKISDVFVSSQPLIAMDWNRQKTGLCAIASLDQTLKIYIVTKLHNL